MCFTETQSYVNTAILFTTAAYLEYQGLWRLSLPLAFLGLKDWLQALLYRFRRQKDKNNMLTILSWAHISFQPLFVNMFFSHFSPAYSSYYTYVMLICFVFGVYNLTVLDDLDIQNEPDCVDYIKASDWCSKQTQSYQGKYHIAYRFRTDRQQSTLYSLLYPILLFLPCLVTTSWPIGIGWLFFVGCMYLIGYLNKLGTGEISSMWCFLSIIFVLPIAVLHTPIEKLLHTKIQAN